MSDFVTIHPEAKIGDNCTIRSHTVVYKDTQIGDNLQTGHFVLIREGSKIGNNCKVGTHSVLGKNVTLGNNVNIQSGVLVPAGTVMEDNVFVGPGSVFANDKYPPQPKLEAPLIKKGASVGANTTILPGIEIGENAMIGAGSVVTKNVAPGTVVIGNPAKFYCNVSDLKIKKDID